MSESERTWSAHERRERSIAALAARQHGTISTAQLREIGLSPAGITRRIRQRRLHRLAIGVYAVGRPDIAPAGRRHAAVLLAGPGATVSHASAAATWSLIPATRRIHVTVPPATRTRSSALVVIHRLRDLHAEDVVEIDGHPVTTVGRTLVDLGASASARTVQRAFIAAERRRLLDMADVDAVLARVGRRPGPAALRTVLRAYDPRWQAVRSTLELRLLELLHAHGLPRAEVDVWVLDRFVADFLWRDARLVLEMDSERFHTTPQDRRADARRDAELRRAGYAVLRVTERELDTAPARAAARIAASLARLAP